jgi:hypothetical protein
VCERVCCMVGQGSWPSVTAQPPHLLILPAPRKVMPDVQLACCHWPAAVVKCLCESCLCMHVLPVAGGIGWAHALW